MEEKTSKFARFLQITKTILSHKLFPIFTAVCMMINWLFGLDIYSWVLFAIVVSAMLVLLDDLTPLISQVLFVNVSVSHVNTPVYDLSGYYFQLPHLIVFVIIGAMMVAAFVYRFIIVFKNKAFKITPASIAMMAFCGVLLLGGIFSSEFDWFDLAYGAILVICLFPVYAVLSATIKFDKRTVDYVCFSLLCVSAVAIIALGIQYLRIPKELWVTCNVDGMRKPYLVPGWGTWNAWGMLLVTCLPAVLYLAATKKFGWIYLVYSVLLAVGVIMTTSRQAYVAIAVVYPLGFILAIFKSKHWRANLIAGVAIVVTLGVIVAIFFEPLFNWIKILVGNHMTDNNGEITGNDRTRFFDLAWENFINYPVFGAGFFAENLSGAYSASTNDFFASLCMCHNTYLQMLSACGILGLLAYVFHRLTSIWYVIKMRSFARCMIGLILLGYLVTCLFDNHIFQLAPTFTYAALYAVLCAGDGEKEEPQYKQLVFWRKKKAAEQPVAEQTDRIEE